MPLVLGGLIYRQLHAPTKFLFEGGGAVQGLGFRDPTPKPYFRAIGVVQLVGDFRFHGFAIGRAGTGVDT